MTNPLWHWSPARAGFPSVGKSSLLTILTGTESEAAAYEFTTLTCIPGVIHYNDAKIQLLDLPGIIEGAAQGKGRGRQVKTRPVHALGTSSASSMAVPPALSAFSAPGSYDGHGAKLTSMRPRSTCTATGCSSPPVPSCAATRHCDVHQHPPTLAARVCPLLVLPTRSLRCVRARTCCSWCWTPPSPGTTEKSSRGSWRAWACG